MPVINAKLSIGEIECVVGVRYNSRVFNRNKMRPESRPGPFFQALSRENVPTVRQFSLSPRDRITSAVASAAIVRDVAALGALVLFGTMLVLVLSSVDLLV